MKYLFLFSIIISSLFSSAQDCKQIKVGNGPEDFVVDGSRFLVSCSNRRGYEEDEIWSIGFSNDSSKRKMVRVNEPEDFSLKPHGIDIRILPDKKYLYAISHAEKKDAVVIYEIKDDTLIFAKYIVNKIIKSPNDLAIDEDGGFYFSNDNILGGNISKCDNNGNCEVVVKRVSFANGVLKLNNTLYYSSTFRNGLFSLNLDTGEKKKLLKVLGADNIMLEENKLYVTSHPSKWKFLKHVKKSTAFSPSDVYRFDLNTNEGRLIYSDSGEHISAASTAIVINNKLYISQVFEPYILHCNLISR